MCWLSKEGRWGEIERKGNNLRTDNETRASDDLWCPEHAVSYAIPGQEAFLDGGQGGITRSVGVTIRAQHIYGITCNVPADPEDSRTPKLAKRRQEPKLAPILPIKRKPYPAHLPSPLYNSHLHILSLNLHAFLIMIMVNGPTKGGAVVPVPGLPHTANGPKFEDGRTDEGGDTRAY